MAGGRAERLALQRQLSKDQLDVWCLGIGLHLIYGDRARSRTQKESGWTSGGLMAQDSRSRRPERRAGKKRKKVNDDWPFGDIIGKIASAKTSRLRCVVLKKFFYNMTTAGRTTALILKTIHFDW